jgi:putative ABC transport system permease protein
MNDLRFAFRQLRKSPGFTVVVVLTLALGIGANSAIFSVFESVILHPLPFKEPSRLIAVWETNEPVGAPANERNEVAKGNFYDWRAQNHVFEQIAALYYANFNLGGGPEPERVLGANVSFNFFQTLGLQPSLGRAFVADEEKPTSPRVAIISHALWQRRFGADPALIGRKIEISGESFTIVGVMPATFQLQFPTNLNPELWTPVRTGNSDANRTEHYLYALARLKPGVSLEQGRAEMKLIASALQRQHPDTNSVSGINLIPLQQQLVAEVQPYLYLLFGAVGFVLLIACANVANLFLARLTNRAREFAIRLALGAGRGRLVRQLLTESLLLSLLGGGLGILLAAYAVSALRAIAPPDLPRLNEIALNGPALFWALALFVLTALLFGLAPALQASNPNLNHSLHQSGRSSGGRKQSRLSRGLVISEIALALLLLVGAGLLIKSSLLLQNVDPGFRPDNLLTLNIALPRQKYRESAQANAFFDQLLERIRALPGATAAGGVDPLPMTGSDSTTGVLIEGNPILPPADRPEVGERLVTPGYFGAMGIPLLRGRDLASADRAGRPQVLIVNEAFAHRFFPNGDALGKRVGLDNDGKIDWAEIVGVVGNVKHRRLDSEIKPELYMPYAQHARNFMSVVVRTSVAPAGLASAIRAEVWRLDPNQPVFDVSPMTQKIAQTLGQRRFTMRLLASFAGVAVTLAVIGIYGVMAYFVSQRRKEIGIRIALGARSGDILGLVIFEGMRLAVLGLVFGLAGSFALVRLIRVLLFGVHPADPPTLIAVSCLLSAVAFLACLLPALRAARINPNVMLHAE